MNDLDNAINITGLLIISFIFGMFIAVAFIFIGQINQLHTMQESLKFSGVSLECQQSGT